MCPPRLIRKILLVSTNYTGTAPRPREGEPLTAAAERLLIPAPGADTEGEMVGFYVYIGDRW
jgi:hypothetical protein